ncbi:hypothetical protein [Streptomyces gibsoniae]|uniref:Uncharacterized protein n=1 Tax=Streptomyces gibsoniae TaxID=3075529 RepID=A0ABU2U5S9_9ACTN|nr:hypothetical protein [Streptomyces sp. DSM 41699]MDT0468591.1 hypothetical protein [Streptomyces sp. DSM 41699]
MRPSGIAVRGVRGVVEDVGLGVDAGPVPAVVGVAEEEFLVGPGVVVELVGPDVEDVEDVVPGVPVVERGPGPSAVVGEVGMVGPPSARLPVPLGEWSVGVGVGEACDWVGTLDARLSIDVPMPPPLPLLDEDAVPSDGTWLGAACGVGEEKPDTEEWPVPVGPDVLGAPEETSAFGALCEVPPGVGSSKSASDAVCRGAGMSEEEGFGDPEPESEPVPESEPESEPGPTPTSGV